MAQSDLKKRLREEYLLKRSLMSIEDAAKLSLLIEDYLLGLPEFACAGSVALYAGVQGEVRTERIFRAALMQGKDIYYPKSDGSDDRANSLDFYKVESLERLTPGLFGVPEPTGEGHKIDLKDVELIIVPGIVFDRTGGRLGFGKGYYDRELSSVSSLKIALAFYMQVLDNGLPNEAHDVKMDMIITERGVESF